jgi:hypothetical protein
MPRTPTSAYQPTRTTTMPSVAIRVAMSIPEVRVVRPAVSTASPTNAACQPARNRRHSCWPAEGWPVEGWPVEGWPSLSGSFIAKPSGCLPGGPAHIRLSSESLLHRQPLSGASSAPKRSDP